HLVTSFQVEVVIDGPGDLGAEPVAGVVGDPALVLILAAEDADGDGTARTLDDAGGGPGVGEAARLEGDLGLGREEPGELVLVLAGAQVPGDLVAGGRAPALFAIDSLAAGDHVYGRC